MRKVKWDYARRPRVDHNAKKEIPVPCPSYNEISGAVDILSDQLLHVYQVLYFQKPKLTDPLGNPLKVKRYLTTGGHASITNIIEISNPRQPELNFDCMGNEPDEEIIKKAKLCLEGEGKVKEQYACCPLAKRVSCVCIASFECPLHRGTCVGSHD